MCAGPPFQGRVWARGWDAERGEGVPYGVRPRLLMHDHAAAEAEGAGDGGKKVLHERHAKVGRGGGEVGKQKAGFFSLGGYFDTVCNSRAAGRFL